MWLKSYKGEVSERDCTGNSNNLVPKGSKLSERNVHAIDATLKTVFERLYLVSGQRLFDQYPSINCVSCHHALGAHTPTAHDATISGFSCLFCTNFFPEWPPQFLCQRVIWSIPVPRPCPGKGVSRYYYCAPLVCVLRVNFSGGFAVWQFYKQTNKQGAHGHCRDRWSGWAAG